ncbi:MAG: hypothetical protein AAF328_09815 [Planctomycetota bacterium]
MVVCYFSVSAGYAFAQQVFVDLGGPATGYVALTNAKNSTSESGISGRNADGSINPNHNGLPDYPYFEVPSGFVSGSGTWTAVIAGPQSTANDYALLGDAFFGGNVLDIQNQAVTQADASTLSAGRLNFDASLLTGVGTEVIPVSALAFDLNTFAYDGVVDPTVTGDPRSNWPPLGATVPQLNISPFSPVFTPYNDGSGAGNAPFAYELTVDNLSGGGLTLIDGQLAELDITGDVTFEVFSVATPFFGRASVDGTLTLSGTDYTFDVVGSDGAGPITSANVFMNRSGVASLVGRIGSLGLAGDFNGSGSVEQGDLNLVLNNWGGPRDFEDGFTAFSSTAVDQEELNVVLNNWGSSQPNQPLGLSSIPEPALGVAALGFGLISACGRVRQGDRR